MSEIKEAKKVDKHKDDFFNLSKQDIEKFSKYSLDQYVLDVNKNGLKQTWDYIFKYIKLFNTHNEFLNVSNFSEMYEIGLEVENKIQKKQSGQYYTPNDVAKTMANWFCKLKGTNICDVGCGTGRLILSYLDLIGYKEARQIIIGGKLYIYDLDETALNICKISIALKFGWDIVDKINAICCDFLDNNIILPSDCKVISNPPYFKIQEFNKNWKITPVLLDSREFYSAFMEKVFLQSESAVIITPYSFISGKKFYSLRKTMCEIGNGFIVSFDNVPGNIFWGKKYGVFNSNKSNSVRPGITVFNKSKSLHGFQLTHLIRFKQSEREIILDNKFLESNLSAKKQIVNENNQMFYKCDTRFEKIFEKWKKVSDNHTLQELIDEKGNYIICMPNTCRYFTVASNKDIQRNGKIILKFSNKEYFEYVYAMINSSFAYWYWRLYDGGITYPKNILYNMPIFFDALSIENREFLSKLTNKMLEESHKYIIIKNNIGEQQNIKFPKKYRDLLNRIFLDTLEIEEDEKIFDIIHSNSVFK